MKVKTISTFEDGDIELLRKVLPDNPCEHPVCKSQAAFCCGCLNYKKYQENIAEYRKRGILDIALKLKERDDAMKQIAALQQKINTIEKSIPEGIIEK
jgi:hypothetical protein